MLIIAIPKSGSSSLLTTLGRLHELPNLQKAPFPELSHPKETRFLHTLHSDLREFDSPTIASFTESSIWFKQHIPPTENNLELLRNKKKVILLRNPDEIIQAYRRGVERGIHKAIDAFGGCHSEEDWAERSKELGLQDDLHWFYNKWENQNDEHTLVVFHADLISQTQDVIWNIEAFFGLEKTTNQIVLDKKRYSKKVGIFQRLMDRIRTNR